MTEDYSNNSYSNIKRISDAELEALWKKFFENRSDKKVSKQTAWATAF